MSDAGSQIQILRRERKLMLESEIYGCDAMSYSAENYNYIGKRAGYTNILTLVEFCPGQKDNGLLAGKGIRI